MNDSPYRRGGVRPAPSLPEFSVTLDSYTTSPYRAERFE
jgi:hypothetical protein